MKVDQNSPDWIQNGLDLSGTALVLALVERDPRLSDLRPMVGFGLWKVAGKGLEPNELGDILSAKGLTVKSVYHMNDYSDTEAVFSLPESEYNFHRGDKVRVKAEYDFDGIPSSIRDLARSGQVFTVENAVDFVGQVLLDDNKTLLNNAYLEAIALYDARYVQPSSARADWITSAEAQEVIRRMRVIDKMTEGRRRIAKWHALETPGWWAVYTDMTLDEMSYYLLSVKFVWRSYAVDKSDPTLWVCQVALQDRDMFVPSEYMVGKLLDKLARIGEEINAPDRKPDGVLLSHPLLDGEVIAITYGDIANLMRYLRMTGGKLGHGG